ncbi:MAG: redoxin domain-containing protein [Desulfobacteraceae bacterium]|nr:redoxin domain-containing protein [Desulfobacteraceae bacterium]
MAQLRRDSDKLAALDVEVLVVGPDKADAFRKYWQKEALPFTGLPDPDHSVMDLYGQEVKIFKLGRLPAQMLIDKSGIVQYVHYGSSMADIPGISEIETVLTT